MLPCSTKRPIKGKTRSSDFLYTPFIRKKLVARYKSPTKIGLYFRIFS